MVDNIVNAEGNFEVRSDAGEGDAGLVKLWLAAIDVADNEEKDWRKRATDVWDRYRDEKARRQRRFNILRSNVKTIRPAIYNSEPNPDIRRRFSDTDPVARVAAQVLERCVSYNLEQGGFHEAMKNVVNDALIPGRGWMYVEYEPVFGPDGQTVVDEQVVVKHAQWDDFRRGPGKTWDMVEWIAVRFYLTRDELMGRFGEVGDKVDLDASIVGQKEDGKPDPDVFKRATIWKIWDKEKRQVVCVAPSYRDAPLSVEDDPLKLEGFFPGPCPLYANVDSQSLVPVEDFNEYRDQAIELDTVTRRIGVLIKCLRYNGIYDATIQEMAQLETAPDGTMVAAKDVMALLDRGGLERSVWFWPIEVAASVLTQLYVNREQIKQTIYEITGISDIQRGTTDPNETLGAQELKAQFGTPKIQERQGYVQEFARNVVRMIAEVIAEHFSPETMARQSGLQEALIPQVNALLQSDQLRGWKIDIETDSTIAADMSQAKQNIAEFVEGFGAFIQAIGPAVESKVMPLDVATDMLVSFARRFKLGKQAEDALERLGEMHKQQGPSGEQGQPQQPDPEQMAAQAKAEADVMKIQMEQQVAQMDMQAKQAEHQARMQEIQLETQERQAEHQMKMVEMGLKAQELAAREAAVNEGKMQ